MHAHRILAVIAAALLGTAAQAAVEIPTSPSFDAPRSARVAAPAAPRTESVVREVASLEQRRAAAHRQASDRTPPRSQWQLPEPPVGALVFAGIGALVLMRGRRNERP